MRTENKTIAILGLARSGCATIDVLQSKDYPYYAWDDNEKSQQIAIERGYQLTPIADWPWDRIDALMMSPGIPHTWPKAHPAAAEAKKRNIPIISDIQIFLDRYPNNPVLAITGTNGKSTTTSLVNHIFTSLHQPALMGGNIGKAVNELKPQKNEAFILELSSYQLEITPHLKPNIAALINITPDHLERHGGIENYAKAKALIFANQDINDIAYIGIDDSYAKNIYNQVKQNSKAHTIPVSVKTACTGGIYTQDGWLIDDRKYEAKKIFKLAEASYLKGAHNHQNIAFAYGMATSFGLEETAVVQAIIAYKGLKHRQQYAGKIDNMIFINDSKATNGEAAAKALSSYKNILWLLGGQIKEDGITECLHFMGNINKAFIFGQDKDELSAMFPNDVKQDIFTDMTGAFNEAVQYAQSHPKEDFVILLSPAAASFDQFSDFEQRGDLFLKLYQDLKEASNHA